MVSIAFVVAIPFWIMVFLTTHTTIALSLLVVPGALLGFYLEPTFAMAQSLADPTIRATTAAFLLLVINLVGLGLGALAVGVLSDALQPVFGSHSLAFALLPVPVSSAWASYHYVAAARTIIYDLAATRRLRSAAEPAE